jgi:hypothetical protein
MKETRVRSERGSLRDRGQFVVHCLFNEADRTEMAQSYSGDVTGWAIEESGFEF